MENILPKPYVENNEAKGPAPTLYCLFQAINTVCTACNH